MADVFVPLSFFLYSIIKDQILRVERRILYDKISGPASKPLGKFAGEGYRPFRQYYAPDVNNKAENNFYPNASWLKRETQDLRMTDFQNYVVFIPYTLCSLCSSPHFVTSSDKASE